MIAIGYVAWDEPPLEKMNKHGFVDKLRAGFKKSFGSLNHRSLEGLPVVSKRPPLKGKTLDTRSYKA